MKLITHRLKYQPGDEFTLYFITDTHIGHALCDEKLLREDVKKIEADEYARWGGGGDFCEFINRSDRRHRESNLAPWLHGKDDIVKAQIERMVDIFKPIADKCLWLTKGNHEDDILDRYERDVYATMVDLVAGPDRKVRLGVHGFVVLDWLDGSKVRWTTTIYTHHGHGGGLLSGGDALMLGRLPTSFGFDLALIGHRHRKHWVPNTFTEPSPTGAHVESHEQHMLLGGSYFASFDEEGEVETYAERGMLPPKAVGGVRIKFYPSLKKIDVVV